MPRKCILIIDDDPQIIELLQETFVLEGWKICTAMDGSKALTIVEEESLDLIILDLLLPEIDGFEVCRRIRELSKVPIIVLSALEKPEDKIKLLNLGADDYMVKPFNPDELLARVEAVFRRIETDQVVQTRSSFICGDLIIDFNKRKVTIAGHEVRLTPTEYNLLHELVINKGKVLTYTHLLNRVWGTEYVAERDYLHVYVRYLRTKIENDPGTPGYIITVPGVGYKFSNT